MPTIPDASLYLAAPREVQTRWASFENPLATKGGGATTNQGCKGDACRSIAPGETQTLLDIQGSGVIHRFWMTQSDRSPQMLRSLRLDMYWDGAATPAVSAPLADFFGVPLGRLEMPFHNVCFSSPEAKSFNCFIPMPFRKSARITLTNESESLASRTYYDINFSLGVEHPEEALYFHAHWRRDNPNVLGQAFTLLPEVRGRGRFLGASFGINTDPVYLGAWWGEGEFKAWLDGDQAHPTLCGTGEEDYIGTGWGQGPYCHPTQGSLIFGRDPDLGFAGSHAMYRFHTVDPIYFHESFRASIDTQGGAPLGKFREILNSGVPVLPCLFNKGGERILLLDRAQPQDFHDPELPDGFVVFCRCDDWSGTAYFYLDQTENDLPALAPLATRLAGLPESAPSIKPSAAAAG